MTGAFILCMSNALLPLLTNSSSHATPEACSRALPGGLVLAAFNSMVVSFVLHIFVFLYDLLCVNVPVVIVRNVLFLSISSMHAQGLTGLLSILELYAFNLAIPTPWLVLAIMFLPCLD